MIDPNESFYAQTTNEMLAASHDWLTPHASSVIPSSRSRSSSTGSMTSIAALVRNEFSEPAPAALFRTILVLLTYLFGARVLTRPQQPLLSSPSITRNIYYRLHRPTSVLATRPHPFFTHHPLPLVLGDSGLRQLVREHSPVLWVTSIKEWHRFQPIFGDGRLFGNKRIVQISAV